MQFIKIMNKNPFEYFISDYLDNINTYVEQLYISNKHLILFKKYYSKKIDNEAKYGHLDVIKWLSGTTQDVPSGSTRSENRKEGFQLGYCTTDAMDWAAKYGHLNVIKWLHENRKEG